ncbi:RNA polymerase sigma-70 factor [Saccharopolyspora taberi]
MSTDSAVEFETYRNRMFGLAYRMLGSAEDAEDIVQDAFLKWRDADRAAIATPSAWLSKVVTNLSLNRLTSARVRREQYVGQWLPEPVLTSTGELGPMETAEQRESVSLAMLVLLESLTPTERAVFVLREAFGYSHREIAELLDVTEVNSRQLHRRARASLPTGEMARPESESDQLRDLVARFLAAAEKGDLGALEDMLVSDVTSWADGGGKVGVARHPILGRDKVVRYLAGGFTRFYLAVDFTFEEVNGVPAALAWVDGVLFAAFVPGFSDGRISAVRIVVNPDKLRFLARQVSRSEELPGSHR